MHCFIRRLMFFISHMVLYHARVSKGRPCTVASDTKKLFAHKNHKTNVYLRHPALIEVWRVECVMTKTYVQMFAFLLLLGRVTWGKTAPGGKTPPAGTQNINL